MNLFHGIFRGSYNMYNKEEVEYLNFKIDNMKEKLDNLFFQDFVDQMSDDFYYTNGRKKAMEKTIIEVKNEIEVLEKRLKDISNQS